jgi:Protein of unknown function (DUF2652)
MINQAPPRGANGPLVLADIGGYTSFLRTVAIAHADDAFADGQIPDAYSMMSSLLDGIVGRLVPPFSLSKLEGDAVFGYATDDALVPHGAAFRACIEACHADFHGRLRAAHEVWSCRCGACVRIDALELKFILHAGPFVIQDIAGHPELIGPEIVMAHRLLKTEAAAAIGSGAYALLTLAAARRLEVPTDGGVPMVVEVEHYPPIETLVFALGRPAG